MSKLDPQVYGPPESAITKEIVEEEIRGFMTLEEVKQNINLISFGLISYDRELTLTVKNNYLLVGFGTKEIIHVGLP